MFGVREYESNTHQISTYPLTQTIIAWDFHNDIVDDRDSDIDYERLLLQRAMAPPKGSSGKEAFLERLREFDILPLKDHYKDEEEYINHYYPLFLIEAKQAIYRAREMEMNESCGQIVSRHSVNLKSEDTFNVVIERPNQGTVSIGVGDLVVLYKDPPAPGHPYLRSTLAANLKDPENATFLEKPDPSRLVNDNEDAGGPTPGVAENESLKAYSPLEDNPHHALGVVDSFSMGLLTIRILVRESSLTADDFKITVQSRDSNEVRRATVQFMFERERYRMQWLVENLVSEDTRWYLAKVMNLTTIYREYQALMTFPDMLLRSNLLLSEHETAPKGGKQLERWKRRREAEERNQQFSIPQTLASTLKTLYNTSQMAALEDCLKPVGITCIQGPPGTGKTTTIMGILSVILNAQKREEKKFDDASPGPSPVSTNDDVTELDLNDPAYHMKRIRQLPVPWLHRTGLAGGVGEGYVPWQDEDDFTLEDIADPRPVPNALAERTFVDLIRCVKREPPKRILVCAPSNAAIDEIVRRLTAPPKNGGGIFNDAGERFTPNVLRVGPNCHPDLKPYSLNEKVNMCGVRGTTSLEALKLSLLEEARIVCCTLSVAGSRELTMFHQGFDTVVVDEASQGVELSTLVPLKLPSVLRLILVGDPRQLPATVFSRIANELNYDQSLFQRLEKSGYKINMLSVQYRMHPRISAFPSKAYYDGNLKDWEDIEKHCVTPLPRMYELPIFRPVVFFSLDSQEDAGGAQSEAQQKSPSHVNYEEIEFIIQLLDLLNIMFTLLQQRCEALGQPNKWAQWTQRVAVISPYAEQVRILVKQIKALFGVDKKEPSPIDVNTVDGFQGREKDFVIFSAVRSQFVGEAAGPVKANVGFLADIRRMNVALTRARLNLWIVGNGRYLAKNPEWGKFVNHCSTSNCMFNVSYQRYEKTGFLKHWLDEFFDRQPDSQHVFSELIPEFINRVRNDSKLLRQAQEATRAALEAQRIREEELS